MDALVFKMNICMYIMTSHYDKLLSIYLYVNSCLEYVTFVIIRWARCETNTHVEWLSG